MSEHYNGCIESHPKCLCLTCINDEKSACCIKPFGFGRCPKKDCPGYKKEEIPDEQH